jgi:hypothetical protein
MSITCSPLKTPVHVSLGSYGRTSHLAAIASMLVTHPADPILGRLSTDHVQICPQNHGQFTLEMAQEVRRALPDICWRLHANVRVNGAHRMVDICDWPQARDYFTDLARLSSALNAPAYSAHAGKRGQASLAEVFQFARELEDLFGVPVGIEGHYPTKGDFWLLSSWAEYRALFASGVHYALDLSHLHILATRSGIWEWNLVREMLACERCIEVHLSANDGHADQHLPLLERPWWFPLLADIHPHATVFSEGSQRIPRAQAQLNVAA